MNNPLVYTDPSGEIIFTLLASLIPGAQFLLPAAIMLDYSWMTGGNRAVMQGESFGSGAWKGLAVGMAGNVLAPICGAGMNFGQNLVFGTVEGALIGGFDAALWGNDVGQGMFWGGVGGAAFTTLTSENFSNWTKGGKFMTNANLYQDMLSRGINNQDILNYFDVQGTYDPYHPDLFDNCGAPATTDKYSGEIFFNETSFDGGYDKLLANASHELSHRADILSGNYQIGDIISFNKSEFRAYLTCSREC